jgi:hypothetical protein
MAKIILGIGSSHGPMLSTPWEEWGQRARADRMAGRGHELWFRGKQYTYDELERERASEHLEKEITPEVMAKRHAACQQAIGNLAETWARVKPDVSVIIGDDQEELFLEDNMPAFAVYWGDQVDNVPMTAEQAAKSPPGIAVAAWGHNPPEATVNPCEPNLGLHIINNLMREEFDVAHSRHLPPGRHQNHSIPHAYGFIYRRIMNDEVIPNVPVFINTFYPPNQPTLLRTYKFGKALGHAIRSWDSDKTVAVVASGGLTHFVVEEDIDQDVLTAMKNKDDKRLTSFPEEHFMSGTSEIRNWMALAGALDGTDLEMRLLDYVPCYRSTAGTGNAMGFAEWLPANGRGA